MATELAQQAEALQLSLLLRKVAKDIRLKFWIHTFRGVSSRYQVNYLGRFRSLKCEQGNI